MIDDEVEPLLEEFGEVENVPEKQFLKGGLRQKHYDTSRKSKPASSNLS